MSIFGDKSNTEKWLNEFHESLRKENYRYKQNIGQFVNAFDRDTIVRLLVLAMPEVEEVIEQMYNDFEKGVTPETSAKNILDLIRQKKQK